MPQKTQLVSGRAGIQTQVDCVSSPELFLICRMALSLLDRQPHSWHNSEADERVSLVSKRNAGNMCKPMAILSYPTPRQNITIKMSHGSFPWRVWGLSLCPYFLPAGSSLLVNPESLTETLLGNYYFGLKPTGIMGCGGSERTVFSLFII